VTDDIEKEARHQGGRARTQVVEEEPAEEVAPKLFADDRRSNDDAAAAAQAARDPEWRKAGGGGGGAAPGATPALADPAAPTGILAFGPPAPPVARALRELSDETRWVLIRG
jgi:hypothetical protein